MSLNDESLAERLALASELLDAMEYDARFATRYGRDADAASGGPAAQALRAFQRQLVTAEMIRPHATRQHAEYFTADELRALIAFYRSPVGRKYARMPLEPDDTIRRIIADAYRRNAAKHEELMEGLRQELRHRGADAP